MGTISFLFIGFILGIIIAIIIFRCRIVGSLRVDNSDPSENPYIFLELEHNLDAVYKKKYVVLKVKIKDFIPRK